MVENREGKRSSWTPYGIWVLILHVLGLLLAVVSYQDHPALLGLGILAYTLGMRHAFDADHIAAIDNTVRKLVQQGSNATGAGFYFALGHSTVVCCMAVATLLVIDWASANMPQMQEVGGTIGMSVSGIFLLLMGLFNLAVLINLYRLYREMRHKEHEEEKLERILQTRGFLSRLLNPLNKFVNRSWHVYPIGFLFGLGFDTASEIALLAMSASAAQNEVPVAGILALPILFAAGMSLFDTADGILMNSAYRWALRNPLRTVYYNISVTGLSVLTALVIGGFELAQVLLSHAGATNGAGKWILELDFGSIGFVLVGILLSAWAISYCVWRNGRIGQRLSG
ncbi:HoxN/HupN/NixA family nickel/cobalt transporter [Cohnella fermenti]|uniref:Nickel/cobalt efflux system n=1 Tax=Cohnella fermenti TaxID=2565925 RepID=A0A4S4C683_9BACL|nr:HoxN/HupN/NixA family nickel/cobalt transporter [Cohnella fermenti]THF82773.1 HoxN/HupN/NixA family nickel/cobalt transporter [Cohnella fermenti]